MGQLARMGMCARLECTSSAVCTLPTDSRSHVRIHATHTHETHEGGLTMATYPLPMDELTSTGTASWLIITVASYHFAAHLLIPHSQTITAMYTQIPK